MVIAQTYQTEAGERAGRALATIGTCVVHFRYRGMLDLPVLAIDEDHGKLAVTLSGFAGGPSRVHVSRPI